jgi:hypothetical protein
MLTNSRTSHRRIPLSLLIAEAQYSSPTGLWCRGLAPWPNSNSAARGSRRRNSTPDSGNDLTVILPNLVLEMLKDFGEITNKAHIVFLKQSSKESINELQARESSNDNCHINNFFSIEYRRS